MFMINQNTESTFTYFNDFSQQVEEFPIRINFKKPMETISNLKADSCNTLRKSNSSKFIQEGKNKRVSFNFKENEPRADH